ncbi:hypothetical protein SAMN05421505_101315 [Sinosporangium album]|uniref:Integral membrane protein n=1 Tax=Sinosporangium album TaxID=504805 RepID=A0A1G7R9L2_9ACTN|nr:hypothetical protein SAMN05421505_101315 [Sinosporangium album]
MPREGLEPEHVQAAFAANRALGPSYEQEIAEGLVDRVNAVIDAKLAAQQSRRPQPDWAQMTLGIVSLVLTAPLVAVAGSQAGHIGVLAAFGIVGFVNIAYALSRALHRRG